MLVVSLASQVLMKKATLVVGLGVVMATLFCFGRGEPTPSMTSGCKERYKIFSPQVAGGGVSQIFVIDTQTGRIWRQMFFTDVKGLYLVPQPYLTADQLAASATPTDTVALESLSLQKQYERELERARQKSGEGK